MVEVATKDGARVAENTIEHVVVVGLGYIGLPTAAILASNGVNVTGVDVNPRTIEAVNRGEVPFVEVDLANFVSGGVQHEKLRATDKPVEADAYIVAVPTPFKDNHQPDLSYIEAAGKSIAPVLKGGELVVLESTSPPGATEFLAEVIYRERPDLADGTGNDPLLFAHCPERVLPGRIMTELVENDRVIGGITPEAAKKAEALYRTFCRGEILLTDARTAEMAKLVENAYRDVNIAFANELSVIADKLNIDVWELIELANHHPRVNILNPGPGVGGHCIAVDPWFIVSAASTESQLIEKARMVNDAKPEWVLDKIAESLVEQPDIKDLYFFGLAFKANIDDLRESPAADIVLRATERFPDHNIKVVEPHVDVLPKKFAGKNLDLIEISDLPEDLDSAILLVDHSAFEPVIGTIAQAKVQIDTRGFLRN